METFKQWMNQLFCWHDYECKELEFYTFCECKKCGNVKDKRIKK